MLQQALKDGAPANVTSYPSLLLTLKAAICVFGRGTTILTAPV